ncbi:MAG: tRNA preQ1(34) S-adenosylmethionine ribosyltransferase-isomerase QueA [Chloroflexi bacterium]|nr:tRNA preQ1(34) S-adenosylmethionine ribosyltransferase-isomerase QueA [Chloroflexota bacterium]
MNTADFDYELPPDRIAQTPIEPRDASRLLVLSRAAGTIEHRTFRDIGDYLKLDDLLVMNESRVIPARLRARKATGGAVEILMLRRRAALTWEVMVGGKGVRLGAVLELESRPGLTAVVMEELDGALRIIQFSQPISPLLDKVGEIPLPPYIHEPLRNAERYQTVYARTEGSAAAPTAGLHFTPELLAALKAKGVRQAFVTLHIGLDTFAPVTEERMEEHKMHSEWRQLPRETALAIIETRARGGRVIAVGTTSVRVLESAARASIGEAGVIQPVVGDTSLFIAPGFQFRAVDAMITNFHLPRSTLLALVSAFAGRETILAAYEQAKAEGYRFYSFGDAMLIL